MQNVRLFVEPIEHIEESPLRRMRYRQVVTICPLVASDEWMQRVADAQPDIEAWLRSI